MTQFLFESDEKYARKMIKDCRCGIHNKKAKLSFDYDRDENVIPHISCCCMTFARHVKQILDDCEYFSHVVIDKC